MSQSHERRTSTISTSTSQLNPSTKKQSTMHVRKMSVFSHRTNTAVYPHRQKDQPTYQLGPARKFDRDLVEKIIQDQLDAFLSTAGADSVLAGTLSASKQFSAVIRQRVKDACFDRYKILSYVVAGQNRDQALKVASSAMWNQSTDDYVSVSAVKDTFFIVAMVFGVYLD